jgi:hypothetical protein
MRLHFCGTVSKDPSYPEAIEDAVEVAFERAAISDGASESFDSKTWARLLVKAFLSSPELTPEWLSRVVQQYNSQYDLATLSWSKRAAFERGSFATLLGVENCSTHCAVDIISIGDSLAVLLEGEKFVESFPYHDSRQFLNRPTLFCTNPTHNGFLEAPDFFSQHLKTWRFDSFKKPIVLCMTDAIGEWALKMAHEGNPQWATLIAVTDTYQLEEIVINERQKRRMRIDDVTLLTLTFDDVVTVR